MEQMNASDTAKMQNDANVILKELQDTVSSKNADLAESKGKIVELKASVDDFDKKVQDLYLAKKNSEKEAEEMKGKVSTLEKRLFSMGSSTKSEGYKSKPEYKALNKFMRLGEDRLSSEEVMFMADNQKSYNRTDSNVDGGFLVQGEFVREIIKKITEISAVRSLASVRTTTSKMQMIPTRTNLVSVSWVGEGEESTNSNSKYGREELPMQKQQPKVKITVEDLEDSEFDMESEIGQDIAEALAQHEGQAFVSGDGVKRPEGFLTNPNIDTFNSGTVSTLDMTTIKKMTGSLKGGYLSQASYVANRRTLAELKVLVDGTGRYLWQNGNLASAEPSTLDGVPVVEMIDMPDIGAGQVPIVLGDFSRGYRIVDRTGLTVIRDPFTLKHLGMVEFLFTKRVGGQVVLPEAFLKYIIQE